MLTVPPGFKEVEVPEVVKFNKKGDSVEGILIKSEHVTAKGGESWIQVYISTGRGVRIVRLGFDLRQKLNRSHMNKHVWIGYVGDDADKGTEDNPMKVFAVGVKEGGGTSSDPSDPGITDDDIPF